jgi:HAD superfamily hydrolase (TIGR01509 family)
MTRDGAITFDFHNTLAHCEPWFELEINDLVPAFLRWRAARTSEIATADQEAAAHAAYRRLRRAIMDHGNELTAERCVAAVLAELTIDASAEEIELGVATLMRETFVDVAPLPGAVDAVQTLAASGIALGIVSNAVYHPFLEWSLAEFGVRDAFAIITTSASAGFYKSRPEIYLQTVRALGARPERSIHVGDSYRFDVGGARRAGMKTVWLKHDSTAPNPDGPPADLTITSMIDLAPQLMRLLGDG